MPAISLRTNDNDLAEIDRRAHARGLTRTAYMLGAALGESFATTAGEEQEARLDDHDARLARLESAKWGE